jgi:hypothetical protein
VTAPALEALRARDPALAGPVRPGLHRRAQARVRRYLERCSTGRLAPGASSSPTTSCGAGASRARPGRRDDANTTRCAPSIGGPRRSAVHRDDPAVGDGLLVATWRG